MSGNPVVDVVSVLAFLVVCLVAWVILSGPPTFDPSDHPPKDENYDRWQNGGDR